MNCKLIVSALVLSFLLLACGTTAVMPAAVPAVEVGVAAEEAAQAGLAGAVAASGVQDAIEGNPVESARQTIDAKAFRTATMCVRDLFQFKPNLEGCTLYLCPDVWEYTVVCSFAGEAEVAVMYIGLQDNICGPWTMESRTLSDAERIIRDCMYVDTIDKP